MIVCQKQRQQRSQLLTRHLGKSYKYLILLIVSFFYNIRLFKKTISSFGIQGATIVPTSRVDKTKIKASLVLPTATAGTNISTLNKKTGW